MDSKEEVRGKKKISVCCPLCKSPWGLLGKMPPLNSSQPRGGHDGPADRPDEALESDLHS
jgi:hypothetical protein